MNVTAFSDPHGQFPAIPPCDLLLLCGDYGSPQRLRTWLTGLQATNIVAIAGNHDEMMETVPGYAEGFPWTYLCDSETTVNGLRIYGTPYTPMFCNWSFMESEASLAHRYSRIPEGLDILLSHGPPYGLGDLCPNGHVGSKALLQRLMSLSRPPRYLFFGHIHESAGVQGVWNGIQWFNVAETPTSLAIGL